MSDFIFQLVKYKRRQQQQNVQEFLDPREIDEAILDIGEKLPRDTSITDTGCQTEKHLLVSLQTTAVSACSVEDLHSINLFVPPSGDLTPICAENDQHQTSNSTSRNLTLFLIKYTVSNIISRFK